MDKQKLKKAGLFFVGYIVLMFVVVYVASVVNHKPFDPNIAGVLMAALLCTVATVYIPSLYGRRKQ